MKKKTTSEMLLKTFEKHLKNHLIEEVGKIQLHGCFLELIAEAALSDASDYTQDRIDLNEIKQIIEKYYEGLNQRKHGFSNMITAFEKIQEVLGMSWAGYKEKANA